MPVALIDQAIGRVDQAQPLVSSRSDECIYRDLAVLVGDQARFQYLLDDYTKAPLDELGLDGWYIPLGAQQHVLFKAAAGYSVNIITYEPIPEDVLMNISRTVLRATDTAVPSSTRPVQPGGS